MEFLRIVLGMILCIGIVLTFVNTGCSKSEKEPYGMDKENDQVKALMKKMTLEDKLNLMDGDTPFWTGFGEMDGEEIVQLYISAVDSKVERAPKELKAFAKTSISGGEQKTVTLDIPVSDIAYYDENTEEFVIEPIEYEVFVGRHSLDTQFLKTRFRVSEKSL